MAGELYADRVHNEIGKIMPKITKDLLALLGTDGSKVNLECYMHFVLVLQITLARYPEYFMNSLGIDISKNMRLLRNEWHGLKTMPIMEQLEYAVVDSETCNKLDELGITKINPFTDTDMCAINKRVEDIAYTATKIILKPGLMGCYTQLQVTDILKVNILRIALFALNELIVNSK